MKTRHLLEAEWSHYKFPVRGIHMRPQEMILQIRPTYSTRGYYEKDSSRMVDRLHVLHYLYNRQAYFSSLEDYYIEVVDRGFGKTGQHSVQLVITDTADYWLNSLVNYYKVNKFCLGLVPHHLHSATLKHLNPGRIDKIVPIGKEKYHVYVDMPYIRHIRDSGASLLLEDMNSDHLSNTRPDLPLDLEE